MLKKPDKKPDSCVRDIKDHQQASKNMARKYSHNKYAVWRRFMQKPEARHFFSGKIFAPRNSLKQVDVKNIVFRKPDNRTKNRISASGLRKLSIWHPKTLLDNVQYTKMLHRDDLGKNRNPDTFCPGKFLHPKIWFCKQTSKIHFLENRTKNRIPGVRF